MKDGNLDIFYRTQGKALPPRPIKMALPGWGGSAAKKMKHGSDPQPWHCRPMVQAATCGFELVYQYEVECHVINDNGKLRIEWDYAREPGGVLGIDEFGFTEPSPPQFYTFATSVDIQAPPGYVLQTQPHPRFFTDDTGTVPLSLIGQVQSEWWPKKLFAVFKVPPPGGRHVFRKGEPYLQIIFVPSPNSLELRKMSPEAETKRREVEDGIQYAKTHIAKNVWLNPIGGQFDDHYKVLERAFANGGAAAVEAAVRAGVDKQRQVVPEGLAVSDYLALARGYLKEEKYIEARDVYVHLRRTKQGNAEVAHGMGVVAAALGLLDLAAQAMSAAAAGEPRSPAYRADLGTVFLRLGRFSDAEASFRASLTLGPGNPQVMGHLGMALAQQGRDSEALQQCRAAVAAGPRNAATQFGLGLVLSKLQQCSEARACFELALSLDPAHEDAKALIKLPADAS